MGRTPCCDKNGLKKGPWTPEEDQKLIDYIQKNGCGSWRTLPKNAGLQRCGKSCRLRWTNYLRPDIKRGRFSFEEEETIIQLHSILGNKWSAIAARLPGRTDNEIKNYWNTHIRKRLLRMGIDPVTHSPRFDLLDLSTILNSSLYNSSQTNLSRLLGMQPLVNPDIIRLASSLFSSQHRQNQGFMLQNNVQGCNNQIPQLVQPCQMQNLVQDIPNCTMLSTLPDDQAQLMQSNSDHLPSSNFPTLDDYVPAYGYFGSDQSLMDPTPSESSTLQSNGTNGFSFQSVLSTRSSSPTTTLRSNSTYNRSSSEEEKESLCSNMLKYEIPDILDVNAFM